MNTIQLKVHVGEDGLLNLQIPTGVKNQAVEVLVVIQAVEAEPSARHPRERLRDKKERARQIYPRAYEPWTEDEEELLLRRYRHQVPIKLIAQELGRQPGGVRSRLKKLGIDLDD